MIKLFRNHGINTDKNVLYTCKSILSIFNIKHTALKLNNSIEDQLDANSLPAVKDILTKYGVQSAIVHKAHFSYVVFETPFICEIQQEGWPQSVFTVVKSCLENKITYLDPSTNSFKEVSFEEFEKIDKEMILLLDDRNKQDEPNYSVNKRKERTEQILSGISLYAFR